MILNHSIKTMIKLSGIAVIICLTYTNNLCAQQNKPVTGSSVPSPTVTVATTPSAYSNGITGNYTRIKAAVAPFTDLNDLNNADYKSVKEATQYKDGLGRPLQTVIRQATAGATPKDLVGMNLYNEFGIQKYRYMPYASGDDDGNFKMDPFVDQENLLQTKYPGEQVFYKKMDYEASPLKRVLKTYTQGNSWAGSDKGKQVKYEYNTTADAVRIWEMPYEQYYEDNYPSTSGEYAAGELNKYILIDEDGKATVEYIDKEGRLILRKVQSTALATANDYSGYTTWLSTYYVYDDFGRLCFVIPPKAVKEMISQSPITWALTSPDVISNLCFWYAYDDRGRLMAKKAPDADWVYLVYDNRDRVVFYQDGNLRLQKQWLATLYDDLNRPVLKGMINYPSGSGPGDWNDFENLQAYVSANTGSGTNSGLSVSQSYSSGTPSDITINSLQTNTRTYKATNSIIWNTGFETDDNTNLTAEIISGSTTSHTESIVINDNPLPSGNNLVALILTYYDEYNFKDKNNTSFSYSTTNNGQLDAGNNLHAESLPNGTEQAKACTRGIVTGTSVRVITDPTNLSAGTWLTRAFFYDEKIRLIQMQDENYKGGTDIATNRYDFSGKVLSSYAVHNNPQNTDATLQTISLKTNILYDHAGRLLEIRRKINNDAATDRAILRNEYNELGQLIKKKVGGIPGAPANDPDDIVNYLLNYSKAPAEILNYDYNVQGWLKGINKDYANGTGSNTSWFGMELSYDWGFNTNQFNGNIAGSKWRSKGDEELRAYGFDYDKANRLQFADFSQKSGSNYADDATINFDMQMGTLSGSTWINSYDDNGNILKMKQYGLKVTSSSVIDDLSYTYNTRSNKLKNVIDANNEPATVLGDFRSSQTYMTALGGTKTTAAVDYEYDPNGNLKKDLNKDIDDASIQAIQYNYLNLPWKVVVKNKGTIIYIYDAAGNKLEKMTQDNTSPAPGQPNRSKSTVYLNGFNYENNELKFFGHEEGRVRVKTTGGQANTFNFDYYLRDNSGNIRVVLTDEARQDPYPVATLEDGATAVESQYYNIQAGNIVNKNTIPNFSNTTPYPNNNGNPPYNPNPTSSVNTNSTKLYKLNGSDGNHSGLGITLKVMTGDVIDIWGKSYYHTNGSINNGYSLTSVLTSFINAFAGTPAVLGSGKGVTGTLLNNSSGTTNGLTDWLQNNVPTPNDRPKAYINWILFDEQFRPVMSNSGFDAVDASSDVLKAHYNTVPITKSGYLYVYCSNESNQNVFFDNLQVIHTRGPLVETNEYYPFGLLASGISYKAALTLENNYKFSSNELQAGEFAAGTGLEFYDFNARMYDAQIGRFMAIDPLSDNMPEWSPYSFAYNNPIRYGDPNGLEPEDDHQNDDREFGRPHTIDLEEIVIIHERNELSGTDDFFDWTKPGDPGSYENDIATKKEVLDEVTLKAKYEYDYWDDDDKGRYIYEDIYLEQDNSGNSGNNGDNRILERTGQITSSASLATDLTENGIKGAERLANSMAGTKYVSELKYLKTGSRFLSVGGIVVSGVDIATNGLNWNNGTDAFFGLVSLLPGVGWVIGGAYFITNEIVKSTTGSSIGDHIGSFVKDQQTPGTVGGPGFNGDLFNSGQNWNR